MGNTGRFTIAPGTKIVSNRLPKKIKINFYKMTVSNRTITGKQKY